jgi:hypothetical protein
MDTDLDALATALYVRVDDLLLDHPSLVPPRPRIGLRPKLPDRVGTQVRSVTHKALGRSAVKFRFTRSSARTAAGSARVVKTFRRRDTPQMPSSRMSRATWSRPMSCPARSAARQSLWAPSTLRFVTHNATSTGIITASRRARVEGFCRRRRAA